LHIFDIIDKDMNDLISWDELYEFNAEDNPDFSDDEVDYLTEQMFEKYNHIVYDDSITRLEAWL